MKIKNIVMLTILSLFLVACGDSRAAVIEDTIELNKEMISILEEVKDTKTAKDAKKKLEDLKSKYDDIEERAEKLEGPDLSPEDIEKEIGEDLMKEFGKTINDLMSVTMEVSMESMKDPTSDYSKAVLDLMDEFRKMK